MATAVSSPCRGGRIREASLLLPLLLILAGIPGCQCSDADILAELIELKGSIQRDFAAELGSWETAKTGAEFRLGDGIRSKKASEAVLKLSGDSYVRLTPESVIRFLEVENKKDDKMSHGIDVETGEAEMVVGDSEVVLFTGMGMATLEAGTRINLKKSDTGMEMRVRIGQATFYDKDNTPNVIKEGEGILVDIGAAILERFAEALEADTQPTAEVADTPEVETDEEPPDTEAPVENHRRPSGSENHKPVSIGEGPAVADFYATAGESFILHVAKPPAVVELRFDGQCSDGAAVEIKKKLVSKGTGSANVLLKPGRQVYRIRCLDQEGHPEKEAVSKGSILVLRDSGATRLPKSAASSFVDTDGRRYKIMYQTRIPNITVRWPRAPKGQKYVLHVSSKKGTRNIRTQRAEHTFPSRELSEGNHQLKFEAVGSLARTSKTTTLDIRFDNAAPKASILEPKEGSFAPGSRVTVSGVAVMDWNVSVTGGQVEMDAAHRFKGVVVHARKYRAISLRLTHKSRGIHYYLRRASGQ